MPLSHEDSPPRPDRQLVRVDVRDKPAVTQSADRTLELIAL